MQNPVQLLVYTNIYLPITRKQISAFRHVDTIKTMDMNSKQGISKKKKSDLRTLNIAWLLVPDSLL